MDGSGPSLWATWQVECGAVITRSVFTKNSHNRHPIARPWGRDMGCHLWVQSLLNVLIQSLLWCMHYRVLLHRAITALHCTSRRGALSLQYLTMQGVQLPRLSGLCDSPLLGQGKVKRMLSHVDFHKAFRQVQNNNPKDMLIPESSCYQALTTNSKMLLANGKCDSWIQVSLS